MNKHILIITVVFLTLSSCDPKKNIQQKEIKNIEFISVKRISILGNASNGILMEPLNQVDSVDLISIPEDFPNLKFSIDENRLTTSIMRVGNYPFKAKVFSNGNEYWLTDTLKIREPSVIISARFGQLLIVKEDNWILVSANGYLEEEITISSNKGKLIKQAPGKYILEPLEEGSLKISAFIIHNGKQRIIATQEMLVVNGNETINEIITSANKK